MVDEVTFGKGQDDFNLAEWAADLLDGTWRYDHTAEKWHHWDGTRWAPDDVDRISYTLASLAAKALDPNNFEVPSPQGEGERKALTKLMSLPAIKRTREAMASLPALATNGDDWDSNVFLLGVKNGVVDLRDNTLIERPDPSCLVTKTTKVAFRPIAGPDDIEKRAPIFWRSMLEWMSGDEDMVAFLLFWFGASMFGMSPEQRFLLMTGAGRNGKGALKAAIQHAGGEYVSELDPNMYMRTKNGAARSNEARADLIALKGKRIAFFSEPSGGQFNEELLKAHTGGDLITARALYSNNVQSWEPTHSITFLTNDLPAVEDVGPSMGERVMVADFRESFEGDKQDRRLYQKLEKEAEGILAILCWAASVWYERWSTESGGLILPERVVEQSKAFMERNDPLANWLNDRCERGRDFTAASQVAYDNYLTWHVTSGAPGEAMSSVKWAGTLQKKGMTKKKAEVGMRWYGFRVLGAMELAEKDLDEDETP